MQDWVVLLSTGILVFTYADDVEFAPPIPEFPGIDPAIVLAALSAPPVPTSESTASFSPAASGPLTSSSEPFTPPSSSSVFIPSSHPSSESFAPVPPSQSSTYSPSSSEEFSPAPLTASAPYSPASYKTDSPYLPSQSSPLASASFSPPPPPFYNVIEFPESAVNPISSITNSNPSLDTFAPPPPPQYNAPYAAAPPEPNSYDPTGYASPPDLSNTAEIKEFTNLYDGTYRLNDGTYVSDESSRNGNFKFSYHTPSGSTRSEVGVLRSLYRDAPPVVVVRGSYSFINPQGQNIRVQYTADENGFQPRNV